MEKKEFVLAIIKEDIINTPLLNGINADTYFLHFGQVIFHMMGISNACEIEQLNNDFLKSAKKARFQIKHRRNKSPDELAMDIYNIILKKSRKL